MAAGSKTRSRNKHLTGKLDNGRTTSWRAEEKERLIDAVKKEKRNNKDFEPDATLRDQEKIWKAVSKAVGPSAPERNQFRCHQHYNNMRKDMERIRVALRMDGVSWNAKTHKLTGSDDAFEAVRPGTSKFRVRAFPYLDDIMQIEGKNVETDDEDDDMKDAEGVDENEKEEPNKKEEGKEDKPDKTEKKDSAKSESNNKDNKKEKTSANGEDDDDGDDEKRKPKKAADQKIEKSSRGQARKKSKKAQESGSNDGYKPETPDDETPNKANGSSRSARYVIAHDEHGGEIIQIPTLAFTDYELSHSRDEELTEEVAATKTAQKKKKKADSSDNETAHSDDDGLPEQPVAHKKTKKKRRASGPAPSSPTSARRPKQPKISDAPDAAAVKKELKQSSSRESSRDVSRSAEELIWPAIEEEGNRNGKGKANRDAPQMATPVKTSPAARKTKNVDDGKHTSDEEDEPTPQERAKREVMQEPMLTSRGQAIIARLFTRDEEEAKDYLRVVDDIEKCRAYLEVALETLGKDVVEYME